ncbi:MAG: 4-alpha-glucanotransferase [Rhodospirillales bacterium]|nr:4-alpha-glucanotransferase [Rhodospirillales bacterium]
MTDGRALDRLAEFAGIEPRYYDIWGTLHEASDQTKRSLLAAMGIPADDDAQVADSMRRLEDDSWQHPLPPVLVVREGTSVVVPVSLPVDDGGADLTLEITEETGAFHRIDVDPPSLPLAERRTVAQRPMERRLLTLAKPLPMGYHHCRLVGIAGRPLTLMVVPDRCYMPACLEDHGKRWGLATHLYTLRSRRDWGMGDFGSLAELVEVAAGLGAASVGVNPLHALFPADAGKISPYSPSSRQFLNPLYLDVEAASGFADCAEAAAAASVPGTAADAPFVDYASVARRKLTALAAVHGCFEQRGPSSAREAYAAFCESGGERLRRFAIFETLSEHFDGRRWQEWPEPYRNPESPEVAAFAREQQDRVSFHMYLQWEADRQLQTVAERAQAAGLEIGIYQDLAVGVDPGGADAWSAPEVVVTQASVGAPPDPFNMLGQDWGTPPLSPVGLVERAYEPFIAMLGANMRHAGALRIDHAMGLMHLFWIPVGKTPADGAYVQYRFEDLLGILALESHRNRCLVIGEDLGTVPDGFRDRMTAANVLSYRVLYFEKDGEAFKRPDAYPEKGLACVTTHDLSTLAGFWEGADIDLKQRLQLYPSPAVEASERASRDSDRRLLAEALADEQLLQAKPSNVLAAGMGPDLVAAVHAYLSRSPACLLMVQIDDVTGESEQINLPGTVDEYPNWRRRLRLPVAAIAATPIMQALTAALRDRAAGAR